MRKKKLFYTEKVGSESDYEKAELKFLQSDELLKLQKNKLTILPQKIKAAEARKDAVKQQIAIEDLNVKRCVLKAPFNARIQSHKAELGQLINRGQSYLTLIDDEHLELLLPLESRKAVNWLSHTDGDADWFHNIEKVPVEIRWVEDLKKSSKGTIERVERYDRKTRTIDLVISIDAADKHLIAGMFCEVKVPGKTIKNVLRIPRSTVNDPGMVYVVSNDKLLSKSIEILYAEKDSYLVTNGNGLRAGDELIISKIQSAVDGIAVSSKSKEPAELANDE